MKAKIGIFQNMRIKNLRAQRVIRISDNVRLKLIQQYAALYYMRQFIVFNFKISDFISTMICKKKLTFPGYRFDT